MIRFIRELGEKDLRSKKVLLRVDFNVPVKAEKIADVFRIKATKETINYLLGNGAKVVLVSHIEAVDPVKSSEAGAARRQFDGVESFSPIVEQISEILERKIAFIPLKDFITGNWKLETGNLFLVDNVRQDKREVENDKGFAEELTKSFDFYVNDAFAVCHREHASVSAIAEYLPSYAGFLIKKETENLSKALKAPAAGKIVVLGGAKISTKLPVIKNFLGRAEKILIGGALANNYFMAKNIDVGASTVDKSVIPDVFGDNLILPSDILIADDKTGESDPKSSPVRNIDLGQSIVDIGPETIKHFCEIIENSSMVIWNGPMGLYEVDKFREGTRAIAKAVVSAPFCVIGGGDTIAAMDAFGLLGGMEFVSTGGGAMLEFLAGNKLPGLEALGYYE